MTLRALRCLLRSRRLWALAWLAWFALVPGAAQVMRVFDITRMRERLEFVAGTDDVTGRT